MNDNKTMNMIHEIDEAYHKLYAIYRDIIKLHKSINHVIRDEDDSSLIIDIDERMNSALNDIASIINQ